MHLKWPPTMMYELSGAEPTLQKVSVQVPVIQTGLALSEMLLMLKRLTASHIPTFEAPVATTKKALPFLRNATSWKGFAKSDRHGVTPFGCDIGASHADTVADVVPRV